MARGRMISKSLSTSEKRAALHHVAPALAEFCQQLYPLLVAHSDDFGRLQGDPFTVKHAIDPTSPRPIPDFVSALEALNRVGLIAWYQAADQRRIVQIANFDPHQPGLHKRTKSMFPALDGHSENFPETPTDSDSGSFPEIPSEEKGIEEKGTERKGTEQKRTSSRTASADTLPLEPKPARVTVDDVVSLWNQLVTSPIPQVTKLTADRRAKIASRLKEYPDLDTWRTVITWVNQQDWCRAPGRGEHPNWTASLDWLCRNGGKIASALERIAAGNPQRKAERPSAAADRRMASLLAPPPARRPS